MSAPGPAAAGGTPEQQRWMRAALALAGRGLGRTWPNPNVGCLLLRDDRVVGRGWTQPGGRPHAEAMALAQAGDAAAGATAYVTLEPCAHHGRTPPCADALAAACARRARLPPVSYACRARVRWFTRPIDAKPRRAAAQLAPLLRVCSALL